MIPNFETYNLNMNLLFGSFGEKHPIGPKTQACPELPKNLQNLNF